MIKGGSSRLIVRSAHVIYDLPRASCAKLEIFVLVGQIGLSISRTAFAI